jgi:hypothetical protein
LSEAVGIKNWFEGSFHDPLGADPDGEIARLKELEAAARAGPTGRGLAAKRAAPAQTSASSAAFACSRSGLVKPSLKER